MSVEALRALLATYKTYDSLSAAYAAEAAAHQEFINEVATRRKLKGPPKGNQNSPHWWHTLVYRLEQQIDVREAEARRLREALEEARAWLRPNNRPGIPTRREMSVYDAVLTIDTALAGIAARDEMKTNVPNGLNTNPGDESY